MNSHYVQNLYEYQHNVAVHFDGLPSSDRIIAIKLSKVDNYKIVFRVEEANNYQFSYTAVIDQIVFNRMKVEQSLEVQFDEIPAQIVKMFKATLEQHMYLKIEANTDTCKLVFFEKSPWKPLVWLTIDLEATDQAEIIDDMARKLSQFKEANKNLMQELDRSKYEVRQIAASLKSVQLHDVQQEASFHEQIAHVSRLFTTTFTNVEEQLIEKLSRLGRRLAKLQSDMLVLKNENKLKCESNIRLVTSLHSLRMENERNSKLLDEYKVEVNHLRLLKNNTNEELASARRNIQQKQSENEELTRQIGELKHDLQEATVIIAKKSSMHDEIAKDLVQANTMLVNFNHQYDNLSQEFDTLKSLQTQKEQQIEELQQQNTELKREMDMYRADYGEDRLQALQHELFLSKKAQQDIEKQHKEAIKLNALLSKKLSESPNVFTGRLQSQACGGTLPPSQRSNY